MRQTSLSSVLNDQSVQSGGFGRRMSRALAARQKFIIICIILANIMALAYFYVLQKEYTATVQLITRQSHSDSTQDGWVSDKALIVSQDMVERLVTKQQLYKIRALAGDNNYDAFYQIADERQAEIIEAVRDRIYIDDRIGHRLIEISFRAHDAALAASTANALSVLYTNEVRTINTQEAAQVLEWISARIDALGEEVKRERLNPQRLLSEDERDIANLLQQAEAALQETEAELEKIDVILYENDGPLVVPPFIRTPLFTKLRAEEEALRVEKQQILSNNTEQSDVYQDWQKRSQDFQNRLEREIIQYANALQVKKEIEQAEIRGYEKQLADLQPSKQGQSNRPTLKGSVSQAVLADMVQSYMTALQDLQAGANPVRVLSRAKPPQKPDRPDLHFIGLYSSLIGLLLGVLLSLLSYLLRGKVESVADVESITGRPVFTVLPYVKAKKGENLTNSLRQDPSSTLAETMRGLFTSIRLNAPISHDGAQVITVMSSCPNEGKTTFAAWLATVAAQNGRKVLIIDADMRRPSLHKAFGIGKAKGIADYLSDRLPLADTIHKKHPSGVHIMTSKAIPVHALMLLSGNRMEALIRRLREIYDFIIIDTPSAGLFAEARMVMSLSDHGFYLIAVGQTPRDGLCKAIEPFHHDNRQTLSIIMNKAKDGQFQSLNMKKFGYYGYKS